MNTIPAGQRMQYLTQTKGPIFHLSPAAILPGQRNPLISLVQRQNSLGYDSRLVFPSNPLRPTAADITRASAVTEFNHSSTMIDGVPVFEIANPINDNVENNVLNFSRYFWARFIKQEKTPSIVHVHGGDLSFVPAAKTSASSDTQVVYSYFDPKGLSGKLGVPTQLLPQRAFEIGTIFSDRTVFWSDIQRHQLSEDQELGEFLRMQMRRGVNFDVLGSRWYPGNQAYEPKESMNRLNLLYHSLIFGFSGTEFAKTLLDNPPVRVNDLFAITQEKGMSILPGRAARIKRTLTGDPRIRTAARNISVFGRGLSGPNGFPETYKGALGTMLYLIEKCTQSLENGNDIAFAINDSGKATRETPITQIEKGSKGSVTVGARTLNQIVACQLDLLAKQMPSGKYMVLSASDNVFGGRITVGDHLLSEDQHGIINLTLPFTVLGEGISQGDASLKSLEQLGILLVDPSTGGRTGFREKIPVETIQSLASNTNGIVDMNSMIKLIRLDVARLFMDAEHYMRPSFKDGEPLIFSYAGMLPDWSKLFDEPSVHAVTLKKWMERHDRALAGKKPEKIENRSDWRQLWVISNDIVLSSLETIALSDEYFGRADLDAENLDWAEIKKACNEILVDFGSFAPDEEIPENWYFQRAKGTGLEANWKELFLAVLALRHNLPEDRAKAEWISRMPAGFDRVKWDKMWSAAKNLDEKDNGIAAGRIDGFWLDTGTKGELFNAWLEIVSPDPQRRALARKLAGIEGDSRIERDKISGIELLKVPEGNQSVHIGGDSHFVNQNPSLGKRIIIGDNVIIRDSTIAWDGTEDLVIPDNTVIYDSEITDVDTVPSSGGQNGGPKLIYKFNSKPGETFSIETADGPRDIRFGFYSGVMYGTLDLRDGRSFNTIFPLELNIKDAPKLDEMEKSITDPGLQQHFRKYYEGKKDVLSTNVPFTDMTAEEIQQEIRM